MQQLPDSGHGAADSAEVRTLRERLATQYAAPFDAIFDSPQAAARLEIPDRSQAIALLIGPLVLGRISTLADFDYQECARAAVDGFLHVFSKPLADEITSASTESAGA
jgi:hypothetical protein